MEVIRSQVDFSKPLITTKDVEPLLWRLYSLRAIEIKEYSSYDDRTYYVKTAPGEGIDGQTEFIFKVLNAEVTSQCPSVVSAQMDILNHLKKFPELKCQVPVATVDGKLLSYEMIPNVWNNGTAVRREDALSAVRMFFYMQGQTLYDLAPLPSAFFYKVGRHIGDLQQALQTYHGDVESLKKKSAKYCWSFDNIPWVKRDFDVVKDVGHRALVEDVVAEYQRTVVPMHGELRKGIVAHDCNDTNTLVIAQPDDYEIGGLIDFDEMMYACLVDEIAISIAYFMQCSDKPLEIAAYSLAGFESRAPLPQSERRLVGVLIAGRLVLSLVYGLVAFKQQPGNDYLTNTQAKGWKCLELLWSQSQQDLMKLWDQTRAQLHQKY